MMVCCVRNLWQLVVDQEQPHDDQENLVSVVESGVDEVVRYLVVDPWEHACDEHRVELHLDILHRCRSHVERVAEQLSE